MSWSKMKLVREWDDKKLASELRSTLRESCLTVDDPYQILIVEAISRILERCPRKKKGSSPRRMRR